MIWYLVFSGVWLIVCVSIFSQAVAVAHVPIVLLVLFTVGPLEGLVAFVWSWRELRWHLTGQEIIVIDAGGIRIQETNLWLSRPRQFLAEHTYGLRYAPRTYRSEERLGWFRQPGKWGAMAFDYGAGTYRFGHGLSLADSNELFQHILKQFPRYCQDVAIYS